MKRKLIFAIAAILAIVSCSKKDIIEDRGQSAPDITASINNDSPNVKTSISVDQEGVGTIWWQAGDKVNIFFGNTSVPYTSTNTEPATTVVFTTTAMIGSTESASTKRWGLYPFDENATCDGSSVTTTVPSLQYAVPETFDNNTFTMLGHSADNMMTFYNVCGGIKFSLARDDIQKITFKGNNNEDIAGKVKLGMDSNNRPEATVSEGQKTIILLPKSGTTFAKNTNYYIVSLPVSMTNGFTMTFETETQVGTFNYTDKVVTISRSKFGKKASIDTYAIFEPSTIKNIVFEDPDVKTFCVKKWDTNKDGELSYAEAAAVKTIRSDFYGQTTFDSFNEFRYFTGIDYLGCDSDDCGAFDSCVNLKSIQLPEGLTYIDEYAFWNCSSLEYIEMPSTIRIIYGDAFHDCTKLNTIKILATTPPDFDDYRASNVFDGVPANAHIFVPDESVDAYWASEWGSYFTWINGKYPSSPRVIINNCALISATTCEIESNMFVNDNCHIIERGFVISEYETRIDPSIETDQKVLIPPVIGTQTSIINILSPGKKYAIRAFCSCDNGVTYSNRVVITTPAIDESIVDPDEYLIYHPNTCGGWDSRNENYRKYCSYVSAPSGAEWEIKLKLPNGTTDCPYFCSGNIERDNFDGIKITSTGILCYHTGGYFSVKFSDIAGHISGTSILTIHLSSSKCTVNGVDIHKQFSGMSGLRTMFAEYYYEYDEGAWLEEEGLPDGTKIYYVKVWDGEGKLVYIGHPGKDTTQNIWGWHSVTKDGEKYEFAKTNIPISTSIREFEFGSDN